MKRLITIVHLCVLAALTAMGQEQTAVGQISITVDERLNPQHKVPGHMTAAGYDGPIGIKLRGNSSLGFNQKKYTIELRDTAGHDTEAALMGMPPHSDWVLLAPYNDVSAVRDPLAFHLWREMGHWGPRTRMAELTLNGEYRGLYILSEAIKKGLERVNIAKLKKTDLEGRDVTGGYILRIDTYDEDDVTFVSKVPGIGDGIMTSQVVWSCIYPKKEKLQPQQLAYIQNFVDSAELVIQSDFFADPERGYARYIDVPSFVDYFIHTELSLNPDGYKRSAYFYKEKLHADGTGGKLVAGPVWDYNLAYGNANFANANNLEAWCFEGASNSPTPALWQRLLQDPAFRRAVKVRYQALRKGVLSTAALNAYIDRQAQLLAPCTERHFATYPELLATEEEKEQFATRQPFGNFPQMPEGFPQMPEGFPPIGAFPQMPEGYPQMPGGALQMPGGFPPVGRIPRMPRGARVPNGYPPVGAFPQMPGGSPQMPGGFPPVGRIPRMPGGARVPNGFPPVGAFPQMPDSLPQFPNGFPMMPGGNAAPGAFPQMPEGFGEGFPMMPGMGNMVGMFAAYRVSSYDEEIQTLKQWLADRLAFLDANIDRFDQDWQPHIQELIDIAPPHFDAAPPFPPFGPW